MRPSKGDQPKGAPESAAEDSVVGRRFTRLHEVAPGIQNIDLESSFNLKRAKASALAALEAAGYMSSDLYSDDGACFAVERVRRDQSPERYDDDSPEALAAQVLQHVRDLEMLLEAYPTTSLVDYWKRVASHGYAIGRCLALAKANGIVAATAKKTAAAPRKGNPIKARVMKLMRASKARGETFKGFIASWGNQPFDDLRLTLNGDEYLIADEGETNLEHRCRLATLTDWWTDANKGRTIRS